ncbi:hypothetical protein COEREDRAFT_103000 [Coemansia reversa NRRL 1564]|uniref:Uncharacterized protein n=1 Tax=Coemansia reversa (strain ATCC 12441 / NRRL 1564) TaxID=763665 RepID=A0A2G5B830_COERN|nr:hypothetical protein COEREDRAFT_103000 [Coemansia reversa NRRL 1564]|eukprot:PIA15142.1 hypothetical protein COEREDRAFT_103000 [Coemansia reversa NRRL 1564]
MHVGDTSKRIGVKRALSVRNVKQGRQISAPLQLPCKPTQSGARWETITQCVGSLFTDFKCRFLPISKGGASERKGKHIFRPKHTALASCYNCRH